MNWELDSILEQSISQIAEGKARVESCLLAYPAHADELAPLLVVSEELLEFPKPAIGAEAKARIEGQLFEAAVASGLMRRERKPLVLPRIALPRIALPRITLPRWRPVYSAVAALAIVVLLLTTTFVGAANALPGSPFYAVKLATEEAWLWVAPKQDEPALHLRFAQRRLEEYQELVERGIYDESVLDAMMAHVDAALDGVEELPPALALELLDTVADVVAGQQQVLAAVLADPAIDLPEKSRLALDRILLGTVARITRIEAMRWAVYSDSPGTLPVQSLTIVPTETAEPGQTLSTSATPTPEGTVEAPAPTSTAEPGAPTSGAPTATSVPTETEVPTISPTDTPVDPVATKKTPPGHTKTPEPPGHFTDTPTP